MNRIDIRSMDAEFLCDLWMKLSQFSNHESIGEEECIILTDIMEKVEQALIVRLQNEFPSFVKVITVFADSGDSELSKSLDPLLKDYDLSLKSPIKKMA
ncbi:hypothetical protein [Bartonella sp. F02]|uniref:hypothetical protein n=1 Tax=Bartonella sp. F02 TaxID=2967262 RepID=UPI0022A9D8A2|nr:hypothetical protein [Bartonella sp. F02]MCZ2328895.1 hypothetical protein [Bartonella sp. F02]